MRDPRRAPPPKFLIVSAGGGHELHHVDGETWGPFPTHQEAHSLAWERHEALTTVVLHPFVRGRKEPPHPKATAIPGDGRRRWRLAVELLPELVKDFDVILQEKGGAFVGSFDEKGRAFRSR